VWIVAILVNAIADMIFIAGSNALEAFWLILIFSSIFSLPGIFVFWLVFVCNYQKDALWRLLFITGGTTSFISTAVFFVCLGEGFAGQSLWLLLVAVLSALASVGLHRPVIIHFLQKQKINAHV
jgi:hypothetical protein